MAKKTKNDPDFTVLATNRRARHDFELLDRYEAGLVLQGTEVKSARAHQMSLRHSYVTERRGELWLMEANIAPYTQGNRENHDPTQPRKLLLKKREIAKIISQLNEKGLTLVPTRVYVKKGWIKVEIALARGKKQYDKRAALAKRDAERQVERALRSRDHY